MSVSVVMTCHDEEAHDRAGRAKCGGSDDLRCVSRRSSSSMTARAMGHESSWSGWTTRSTNSGSSRRRGSGLSAARNLRGARSERRVHRHPGRRRLLDAGKAGAPATRFRDAAGTSASSTATSSISPAMTRRTAASSRCAASTPKSAHQLRDYFVHDGPIMPSTLVVRRSVFDDVGLFDESLRIGEDTEFCLRVAEKWRFCHVPGAFTFKRRHPGQISARLDALLPNAARVTQEFRLTPFRAQVTCGPPNGAGPRKGQRRLCDERRMAQGAASRPPRNPPRPALLARLGQRGPPARASVCRAALLRGAQEAVACLPAVVAFRLTILVRARMRILYVVNGFDQGGAEHGLLTLVENGAFEDHELRVLALCRGRGDLADLIAARLGKRVQFVTNGDTLTFWACSAGFFSILRTSFAFRPQKMVLSLKQANVVGRSAAMLMPRSDLRGVRAHSGIPSSAVPGAVRTAPALAVQTRRRGVGRFRRDTREDAPLFLPRERTCHVIPLFVAAGARAVQDRLCIEIAFVLRLPGGSSRGRTYR